jgi:molybdopterin converting factor small subunit
LKNLAHKNHDFISWQNRLLVAVNCEHVRESDRVLMENDEVALMPPLSGG